MSAFVVSPTHVDVILSVALHGPGDAATGKPRNWSAPYVNELLQDGSGPLSAGLCSRAGAALLEECILSVSERYRDGEMDDLPGPIPTPRPEEYEFTDFGSCATIAEACRALDCFEYQSCEHPGWSDSGARYFCERLRANLTAVLPGAYEAPWEWTPETLAERGLIPRGA